jgi:hypothetical protein
MVERKVGNGIDNLEGIRAGDVLIFDRLGGEPRELVTGFDEGKIYVVGRAKDHTYHGIHRGNIDWFKNSSNEVNSLGSEKYAEDMAQLREAGIVN